MIISTDRLILRPWQLADLLVMAAWPRFTSPLDADWNWPQELSDQGMLDLFFAIRNVDPKRRHWTILTKQDEVVGYIDLRDLDQAERSTRLGIQLGQPYIQQGYGSEALRAFLDTYFGVLQFRCIRLDVGLPNLRARRLYERLGFRAVHTFWRSLGSAVEWSALHHPRYASLQEMLCWSMGSVYMQHVEMELTAEEWKNQEARIKDEH